MKTFFFFFFFFLFIGDHLILGEINVWISDFGRKISLNFGEDLFFGDHLILGEKNVWISDFGRKISLNFGEDLFFFFFLFYWRPPDFGRKKRLNLRFRPKNQSQFWWRHPNFWGFGFKSPPTKIFWIRHCTCPPVYHTQWRIHEVPFNVERPAKKLFTTVFIVFGLTRAVIEPGGSWQKFPRSL